MFLLQFYIVPSLLRAGASHFWYSCAPAALKLEHAVLLQFCSAPGFFKAGCHVFAVVLPFCNLVEGWRLPCLLQFFRDRPFLKAVEGLGCSFALLCRPRSRPERSIFVTASRTKAERPIFPSSSCSGPALFEAWALHFFFPCRKCCQLV